MLSLYSNEDYAQVFALWQEAFGDTKDEIDACLALFAPYLYVCKIKNKVVSMLMRLPLTCGSDKGEYIYAVATKKEARGLGLATDMLTDIKRRVEDKEIDFLALVPAKSSLFDFYAARGFKVGTHLQTVHCQTPEENDIKISDLSANDYHTLRSSHFPRIAAWDTQMLANIEALYGKCYYRLEGKNGNGFCMAYTHNNKLTVCELCLNTLSADAALASLCSHFGVDAAQAKLPSEAGEPFAMFYPPEYADTYFNLAIN